MDHVHRGTTTSGERGLLEARMRSRTHIRQKEESQRVPLQNTADQVEGTGLGEEEAQFLDDKIFQGEREGQEGQEGQEGHHQVHQVPAS
jgi:hypothetical protein